MKNSKLIKAINTMMILATLSAVPACASSNRGSGGGRGGMQGPPPEAIEACEGKSEGDSVTFAGRRGDSVPATCTMVNDQLVAVPEGHKLQ